MATYAEPIRGYEAVLSDSGNISYENVAVGSGADLVSGAVLGKKNFVQAAAPIPTIVGTGTGLMSALTFGPDVQVGSYVITLTATSATAAFSVVAPDGTALPAGAVGTAYKSTHLSFLISNGGTMTLGDYFNIVVANQANVTGRYYAYDPTAVDGTQEPVAVLVQPAAAASVAVSANAVARLAEVKLDKLTWKANVSAAQKIAAAKQLAANSTIVVRS